RETVRWLEQLGNEVRVVTGQPRYPRGKVLAGFKAWTVRRGKIDSVPVVRLPVISRASSGFKDRIADQLWFAMAALATFREARRSDVLLVESPPLFLGLSGHLLARLAGIPYV